MAIKLNIKYLSFAERIKKGERDTEALWAETRRTEAAECGAGGEPGGWSDHRIMERNWESILIKDKYNNQNYY